MSYDVIPSNYPSGSTNKEIEEAIQKLQQEIAGNSRVESTVVNRSALIQLGQTELSGRFTKKTSTWSLGISVMSLLFSFLEFILQLKVIKIPTTGNRNNWRFYKELKSVLIRK